MNLFTAACRLRSLRTSVGVAAPAGQGLCSHVEATYGVSRRGAAPGIRFVISDPRVADLQTEAP